MKQVSLFIYLIGQTMAPNNILFESAGNIAKAIKSGKISTYEVVNCFIEHIEKQNKYFNAIVLVDKAQALAKAKAADEALAKNECLGKLHGVPITIKDNFKTKGLATTSGYKPLMDNIPDEDADIVKLLLYEGAIIIGKTNLSVLAMDMQTDNPVFGRTNNPWDTTLTSGGSSGGCAAALATGMTPLSFGNDLAGSIRVPAAMCGVYGFKPSFGAVSLQGIQTDPKERTNGLHSLAVAGPLARSIDDLDLAMQILAKPSATNQKLVPLAPCTDTVDIRNLRIAWTDELGAVPVDEEIKQAIRTYVERLEAAGANVVKATPNINFDEAWKTWGSLVGMQGGYATSNLVKWLGLPFTRVALKHVPMHQNIVKPTSVEKYMMALNIQQRMITAMENFLRNYDAFICPVSAVTAFAHHKPTRAYGHFNIYNNPLPVNNQPLHYYMATQAYTTPFSLTESPVLSMPVALSKRTTPIGIQVIGKRYGDFRLLQIGKTISAYSDRFNYPLQKADENSAGDLLNGNAPGASSYLYSDELKLFWRQ